MPVRATSLAACRARAAHAGGELGDQVGDRLDGARGRPCRLRSRLPCSASTSAEPTTTPSAPAAIARACSAVRTPKPTATGSVVWRLMRATALGDLAGIGRRRAGDAGDRDVVDEARGVREHGRQALVVGRRRREADEVEPGLAAPAGRAPRPPRAAGRRRSGRRRRPPSRRRGSVRRRRCRSDCSSPSARSASRRRVLRKSRTSASVFIMCLPGLERAQRRRPGSPGRPPSDR